VCGTNRGWQPLGPGQSISLCACHRELGLGLCSDHEAKEFREQNGDLNALPARVGIQVTCDQSTAGDMVYSDVVALLRKED
jgi:hypothetical protein